MCHIFSKGSNIAVRPAFSHTLTISSYVLHITVVLTLFLIMSLQSAGTKFNTFYELVIATYFYTCNRDTLCTINTSSYIKYLCLNMRIIVAFITQIVLKLPCLKQPHCSQVFSSEVNKKFKRRFCHWLFDILQSWLLKLEY